MKFSISQISSLLISFLKIAWKLKCIGSRLNSLKFQVVTLLIDQQKLMIFAD